MKSQLYDDAGSTQQVAEDYHEHPFFNGQYHRAVWVKSWVSSGTTDVEAPDGTPIQCAICGRTKEG